MGRPPKLLNNFKPGSACKGKTTAGEEIIGNYVQAGPTGFAFIKGVVAKNGLASPFVPPTIFKVTRKSLKKQA